MILGLVSEYFVVEAQTPAIMLRLRPLRIMKPLGRVELRRVELDLGMERSAYWGGSMDDR